MTLQADSGKVSACKTKEHRMILLAPRVDGKAEGEGGERRQDDASGLGALALATHFCQVKKFRNACVSETNWTT